MLDLTRSNQKLIRPSSGCKQSNRSAILICRRQMDRLFKYKILAFQVHQLPSYSVFPQNSNFPGEKFSRGKNFPKETFYFPAVTFLSQGKKKRPGSVTKRYCKYFFLFPWEIPREKKRLIRLTRLFPYSNMFYFPRETKRQGRENPGKKTLVQFNLT